MPCLKQLYMEAAAAVTVFVPSSLQAVEAVYEAKPMPSDHKVRSRTGTAESWFCTHLWTAHAHHLQVPEDQKAGWSNMGM